MAGSLRAQPLLSLIVVRSAEDGAAPESRASALLAGVSFDLTESRDRRGVVEAVRAARGKFVCVIERDAERALALVPDLLAAAQDADVVVASRRIAGGARAGGMGRRAAGATKRVAASALFRRVRACTDPLSPLYVFRRDVLDETALDAAGDGLLLDVLARGRWARLTELPYAEEADGKEASDGAGSGYARRLRALRFGGPHGRGAVRYRRQRVAVGPDDPQPLDDDLPDDPEIAGPRRRRMLWIIGLMALALRLVLLPLGHYWDLTVDYNVFVDLARGHSPYDTMVYLSHIAVSSHWDTVYEYYAYPPVPLYLYWPLAHVFAWLHPHATYFIPVSGSFALPNLPWDFYLWLKAPIWAADFLIAALLARMSGTIRGWRDYLLNPYVLLVSGAWTFDAVMLLGLVLGVYWIQKGRFAASGLALAFGTMVKFFPALAVPTLLLFLIKRQRPLREMVTFVAAYVVGCALFLGPFVGDVLYELGFHGSRVGGGMNWEMLIRLGRLYPKYAQLDPPSLAIAAFGTPMLVIALLLGYWYAYTSRQMRLNRMVLVTFLAFLLGSKLVNEQYALLVLPFALLEAYRVGGAWKWLARLLWIVPLAFAVFRVPIGRFLWLFYHTVLGSRADKIATTGITGTETPFLPWNNPQQDTIGIAVLAVGFYVLCLVAILWPVRPAHPWRRYDPLRAAPLPWAARDTGGLTDAEPAAAERDEEHAPYAPAPAAQPAPTG